MRTSRVLRRATALLCALALVFALGGCWEGNWKPVPDRTKPPAPSKVGTQGSAGYFHGGLVTTAFDAGAG